MGRDLDRLHRTQRAVTERLEVARARLHSMTEALGPQAWEASPAERLAVLNLAEEVEGLEREVSTLRLEIVGASA